MVAISAVMIANGIIWLDINLLFLLPAAITGDRVVKFTKSGAIWAQTGRFMNSAAGVPWFLAWALGVWGLFDFGQRLLSGYIFEYLPFLPMVNAAAFSGFILWYCRRNNYAVRKRWRMFAMTIALFLLFEPLTIAIGFGS